MKPPHQGASRWQRWWQRGPPVNEIKLDSSKSKRDEKGNLVPFHKLFSFADSTDILLMVVGSISAVGNDLSLPLMTL
ncbi:hypothetical protein NL676_039886 [Syzygium grande]|nr:hypothetical protein NL676_039886 [Syzygium grande]